MSVEAEIQRRLLEVKTKKEVIDKFKVISDKKAGKVKDAKPE